MISKFWKNFILPGNYLLHKNKSYHSCFHKNNTRLRSYKPFPSQSSYFLHLQIWCFQMNITLWCVACQRIKPYMSRTSDFVEQQLQIQMLFYFIHENCKWFCILISWISIKIVLSLIFWFIWFGRIYFVNIL